MSESSQPGEQAAHGVAVRRQTIQTYQRATDYCVSHEDTLADEVPVALQYNGINHVVMLASATHLVDLAYGFSYSEGIIRRASDIYDCEIIDTGQGFVLDITIASACLQQLKLRRRRMTGQTGCGLCGIESLEALDHNLQPLPDDAPMLSSRAIYKALSALRHLQPLRAETGATHAAGWADFQGQIKEVREDVGRHNALDKLIGHLLRSAADRRDGFVVVSSRASFEMVQKTVQAGIPALVAVSAPTSMAVQTAMDNNLILVGFARRDKFNIYSGAEHLIYECCGDEQPTASTNS